MALKPSLANLLNTQNFVSVQEQPLTASEQVLRSLLLRESVVGRNVFGGASSAPSAPTGPAPQQAPTTPDPAPTEPAPSAPQVVVGDPMTFTRVQPGDLMTADYINGVIDALHLLDLRLLALESTQFVPSPPQA